MNIQKNSVNNTNDQAIHNFERDLNSKSNTEYQEEHLEYIVNIT